jgi:ribose 5-phosphate isomerase B
MKVACGFDHAGFPFREKVFEVVQEQGHEVLDLGTKAPSPPVDYPDVAEAVGAAVVAGDAERGVIVCGSGAGVAIAACKIHGIRSSVVHDSYTAHQAVEHDDMNVICMGARVIGPELAADVLRAFLRAQFTHEERHERRLTKVIEIERGHTSG